MCTQSVSQSPRVKVLNKLRAFGSSKSANMSSYGSSGRASSQLDAVQSESGDVLVVVPPGVNGGDMIAVRLPGGGKVNVSVPHGCYAGDYINVPLQTSVAVTLPSDVRPGDLVRATAPNGEEFCFIAPPSAKPNKRVTVDVPRAKVNEAQVETLGDSAVLRVRIPDVWDGYQLLAIKHGNKTLLVQAPDEARSGDEMLVDLPVAGRPVDLAITVPHTAYGGDTLYVTSPSGKLMRVELPPTAEPGDSVVVRATEMEDDEAASRPQRTFHDLRSPPRRDGSVKRIRTVIKGRLSRTGKAQINPVARLVTVGGADDSEKDRDPLLII